MNTLSIERLKQQHGIVWVFIKPQMREIDYDPFFKILPCRSHETPHALPVSLVGSTVQVSRIATDHHLAPGAILWSSDGTHGELAGFVILPLDHFSLVTILTQRVGQFARVTENPDACPAALGGKPTITVNRSSPES